MIIFSFLTLIGHEYRLRIYFNFEAVYDCYFVEFPQYSQVKATLERNLTTIHIKHKYMIQMHIKYVSWPRL